MREVRAKSTNKHARVDRFGAPTPHPIHKNQVVHAQVVPRHNGHQAPAQTATASSSSAVALPSMVTSASHNKLERLLDVALTSADAHKQAMRYEAARHFWQRPGFLGRRAGLKITLSLIILLVLVGFVAWRKIPQLSLKVAGTQAHVNASVPSYIPAGYSQAAPASNKDSAVVIKYRSTSNNSQSYDIAQKESNMTSTSMAQSVIPAGTAVQTSQVGGNTVYIYGQQNNATWVNNGVLYKITDHAQLSSDEILKIVQGLN